MSDKKEKEKKKNVTSGADKVMYDEILQKQLFVEFYDCCNQHLHFKTIGTSVILESTPVNK